VSTAELEKIKERYKRRTTTYEPWVPWIFMSRHELERAMIGVLFDHNVFPPRERRVLDVGCGIGTHLHFFLRLGFQPEALVGIELQPERIAMARAGLPVAVSLLTGDASQVDLPEESFDVVFQSLVFSSILDDHLQVALAKRMWRLAKPGGGILWYDFTWDNPRNPDVRGVPINKLRDLFPATRPTLRRVTLAPPLARLVTRLHPAMYSLLGCVPLLRTHVLGWFPKPLADSAQPRRELT
jgi:SAM-dependent methyltransferase